MTISTTGISAGYAPILNKLGTIRNQCLIFVIISAIIITGFSLPLSQSDVTWKAISGVTLQFMTTLMLIAFGGFYFYATLLLPANENQSAFQNTVRRTVAEHEEKLTIDKNEVHLL